MNEMKQLFPQSPHRKTRASRPPVWMIVVVGLLLSSFEYERGQEKICGFPVPNRVMTQISDVPRGWAYYPNPTRMLGGVAANFAIGFFVLWGVRYLWILNRKRDQSATERA